MSSFENDPIADKTEKVMAKIKPYLKDSEGSTYNRVFEAVYDAILNEIPQG